MIEPGKATVLIVDQRQEGQGNAADIVSREGLPLKCPGRS